MVRSFRFRYPPTTSFVTLSVKPILFALLGSALSSLFLSFYRQIELLKTPLTTVAILTTMGILFGAFAEKNEIISYMEKILESRLKHLNQIIQQH